MRSAGRHCDLEIKVEGGEILNAHRGVLATRLSFFDFEIKKHTVARKANLQLSWGRFPKEIVDQILDFIYIGEVSLSKDNVERLYLAAFMLKCDKLQNWCLEFMAARMTKEKLPVYLEIARIIKSETFYSFLFQSSSFVDFVRERFHKHEIFNNLEMPCTLLKVFKSLVAYIGIGNLSQQVVDRFRRGYSIFSVNFDCAHFFEIRNQSVHQSRILVYGPTGKDEDTGILMSCSAFKEIKPIEIRCPYLQLCGVASLMGKVYFVGGLSVDSEDSMSTVTVVELNTGEVSQAPALNTPRRGTAVAASSKEIFACGGFGGPEQNCLNSCERYALDSASWNPLTPLNQARVLAAAEVVGENERLLMNGEHLIITGGCDVRRALADVALLSLDVDDPKWIDLAPMHHARYIHAIALYVGRVFVAGGNDDGYEPIDSVEMMKLPQMIGEIGQWTELAALGRRSWTVRLAVRNNRLFSFEYLSVGETKIEEFIDETPSRNDAQVDRKRLERFTWREIGDGPNVLDRVESAFVVKEN